MRRGSNNSVSRYDDLYVIVVAYFVICCNIGLTANVMPHARKGVDDFRMTTYIRTYMVCVYCVVDLLDFLLYRDSSWSFIFNDILGKGDGVKAR
jgi:hypothetical protein